MTSGANSEPAILTWVPMNTRDVINSSMAGSATMAGNTTINVSLVINQGSDYGFTPDIDGVDRPQGAGYDMKSDEYVQ